MRWLRLGAMGKPIRLLGASIAMGLGLLAAGSSGCGGPSKVGCLYDSWKGTCALKSVTRLEVVNAFPRSYVRYEALYAPTANSNVTPPDVRHQFQAPALEEDQLIAHINAHPNVACESLAPPGGGCSDGQVRVAIAEYVSTGATNAPEKPTGCRRLEAAGRAPAKLASGVDGLPHFLFQENSDLVGEDVKAQIAKARCAAEESATVRLRRYYGLRHTWRRGGAGRASRPRRARCAGRRWSRSEAIRDVRRTRRGVE